MKNNRFYSLENEYGFRFPFQDFNFGISYTFEGNSLEFDNEFTKVGDFFEQIKKEIRQKQPSFTCGFKNNEKYQEFIRFVTLANSLKIVFQRKEQTFYIDVVVKDIRKNDVINREIIIAEISFDAKSSFYEQEENEYALNVSDDLNRFPFSWNDGVFRFDDQTQGIIEVRINGTNESSFELIIDGPATEASYSFENNGISQGVKFDFEIGADEQLHYSTKDNDLKVLIIKNDGTTKNAISFLDYKKNNFPKLAVGLNLFYINNVPSAKLKVFDRWDTV